MVVASESLVTFLTFERLLTGVGSLMVLQDVFVPKRSVANEASEDFLTAGGAPGPPTGASVGRGRRPRGGGRRHRLGGVRRLREAGKAEERRPDVGRQPVDAEIVGQRGRRSRGRP